MVKKLNIPCVWGGHLAGVLLKSKATSTANKPIRKVIGTHGWLDNLNALLPIAENLVNRHPNYEIYLYDRPGHGFSSHLPKGSDYSFSYNLRDLRTITRTLGWNNEKFSFIAHSYGVHLAMGYAAGYPEEISCIAALDSIIAGERSTKSFWKNTATRIDKHIEYYMKTPKSYEKELSYEKAIELVRSSRTGIDDASAKLLVERSIRRDKQDKLHFTRDEALKNAQLLPSTQDMADEAIKNIKASVLFIRTVKPQWPLSEASIELFKKCNPNFEMSSIDGSHHFHMTYADDISERIHQHFDKYFK